MPPKIWSPQLWGAHLLALVLLAGTVGLGLWQLGVWRDHRNDATHDATKAAAKPLSDVMGPDDPFPGLMTGHPVTLSGDWVPSGTVYVSGRLDHGVDGYWVVTPLAVGGPDRPAMPVVRGWVKDVGLAPAPPSGSTELTGWLQPPEGSNDLSDDDPTDDVLPQLRIADVIQHVDQDLYGGYVVDQQPGAGLARADLAQLPEAGTFTGLRNFLYGLEWWVFAGFVVYIWWRHVRDVTTATPEKEPQDDAVPSGT
ncbi:Cytochrome oxidase assembly protein ShyY1 [Nocardioides terrae]|uniref:SURF1-like protein n=1 Tax=Nocardioides terrae TaxID=574651 RepID=A0A1I1N120_9ACTN|nr:SURF1 family protein [Nocardioides terrae]SFC91394.1 Cytochrome oxidase assembly protein ShyY1 [Nocardioides terrae]